MARLDEISQRIERRLQELLEESARLRAALEALGHDDAPASRRLHAGRTAKPVVKTLSRSDPVKPSGASAVTLAQPNSADGDDATPDTPVERIIHQVRQELAAGLRAG
jgi:hypothetical protein